MTELGEWPQAIAVRRYIMPEPGDAFKVFEKYSLFDLLRDPHRALTSVKVEQIVLTLNCWPSIGGYSVVIGYHCPECKATFIAENQHDPFLKDVDYELTVAMVDLDEKTEKEQVVFLNNELCQGTYDVDALQKQIEKGLDYSKCGFTESQLSAVLPNWDPPTKEKKAKKKGPDAPPHCVLVFRDRAQSDRFLQMMGMSQMEKFLAGPPLLELVKRGTQAV
jgi:hypothetical protein